MSGRLNPRALRRMATRAERRLGLGIVNRSEFVNVYHCCVQRTASQWFRGVFNDPAFYRHTGLYVTPYIDMGLDAARIQEPFPTRSVIVHLYVNRSTFEAMPKREPWQAFFVTRDPRDIVVSFYFSAMHSHKPLGVVPTLRPVIADLDRERGMAVVADTLADLGLFEAQRSWGPPGGQGPPVFRYEALAADHRAFLAEVFEHLRVSMPEPELEQLCERRSFRSTTGREQGVEDLSSHARRGVAGDWRNHLTPALEDHVDRVSGGLAAELGYS